MRKVLFFATLCSLCLHGQEITPAPSADTPAPEDTIQEMDQASAAAASTQAARSSEWQNWVFASSAAVVFTVAVLIVSLNTGSPESASQ